MANSYFITLKEFLDNIEKGLLNKRTTTFFILQISIAIIFGFFYYLAIWHEINIVGRVPEEDEMQLNIFEAMYYSFTTQTTVGYSDGYSYLGPTGRVINFIQLCTMLAVFLVI